LCLLSSFIVNVVLVGGVAASVAAMIPSALLLSPSIMVYIAGAITIANAPYSAFKEVRVARIPTMRALNDKLRDEAHRLEGEMDALSEEIDAIAPEAKKAGAAEEQLREIADQQNFNMYRLIDLVNESEKILDQMRDNLRQKVAQDIIRIVIKSDISNDQKFCVVESKVLALKIRIQLQEYGVEFDEMKFYEALNKCPTVPRVVAIVQKLIPGLGQDDDSTISPDDDEDGERDNHVMFRLKSDKSLRMTGSLQDFPERRQSSSALVKCSSWRDAVGTSVASGSVACGPRQMSETKQVILALSSVPSRRSHNKRSSLSKGRYASSTARAKSKNSDE
jgi:Skp family chaperone for outer membrane proteins